MPQRAASATDTGKIATLTDPVAQYRRDRVGELDELFNLCREERLDPAVEAANIVARARELYLFSPDFRSLIEHLHDLSQQYGLADWANNGSVSLTDQPWSRIADSFEAMLNEPALYQRNWAHDAIEPQFRSAIAGWPDLAKCVQEVQARSSRTEMLDPGRLVGGAVGVFLSGCQSYFRHLGTTGAEDLEDIFSTIITRPDYDLGMFPSALTYYGADGLQVLNRIATETDRIIDGLLGHAEQRRFDRTG